MMMAQFPSYPFINNPTAQINNSSDSDDDDLILDAFSGDEFRIFEFKIRRCARSRAHDWTDCPFAHPGEKARRRDPRKYNYSGVSCPEFRKGCCRKGDGCEFAHGVFESWLHPTRYRTQPCKDGTACRRRVCFFAHTPEQLRVVPVAERVGKAAAVVESYDGSPIRQHGMEAYLKALLSTSPTSTLFAPSESPPVSPLTPGRSPFTSGRYSLNDIMESIRRIQLTKVNAVPGSSSRLGNGAYVSPKSQSGFNYDLYSLPSTPTRSSSTPTHSSGLGDSGWFEEEMVEERVESGRALRAKMFEKLSKDIIGVADKQVQDAGWNSALVI